MSKINITWRKFSQHAGGIVCICIVLLSAAILLEQMLLKTIEHEISVNTERLERSIDATIRGLIAVTDPREYDKKLAYIAAELRLQHGKLGEYPPYGVLTNRTDSTYALPAALDGLVDYWGTPYLFGEFPVIVKDDYYLRVDTQNAIDEAKEYLNGITNLQIPGEM